MIVSASLFLPVVLETFARQNGVVALQDGTGGMTPCPPSAAAAGRTPPGSPSPPPPEGGIREPDGPRCVVRLGGVWIDTGQSVGRRTSPPTKARPPVGPGGPS